MSAEEYVPDRLRALGYPSHANEVERLIGEIARLQAELARVRGLPRLSQLDDENQRLRAENEQLLEQIALRQPSVVERDMQLVMQSNNKLRAALEEIANECDPVDPEWSNPVEARQFHIARGHVTARWLSCLIGEAENAKKAIEIARLREISHAAILDNALLAIQNERFRAAVEKIVRLSTRTVRRVLQDGEQPVPTSVALTEAEDIARKALANKQEE
jgi:hypothetical protein